MIELNKWYKAEERGSRAVQDVDFDAYNTVLHLVKIYDVENVGAQIPGADPGSYNAGQ